MSHTQLVQVFCTIVNRYPASRNQAASAKLGGMAQVTNRDHLMQVAQNIELAREALGLTKTELAEAMGISVSKLGNWRRGDNYPDPYLLTVLCDRFGLTMDFIYRGRISGLQKDVADGLAKEAKASAQAKRVAEHQAQENS